MKILIIEDEVLLADSLKTLLESKGFEAEAVYDGESGAAYAELGVYDLLILDVMMPGLNGYQVARQVRARRCGAPILMLTAKSDVLDRVEGLSAQLKETIILRETYPELTLSQLAEEFDPPITKSGLNHRLRKLVELSKQ